MVWLMPDRYPISEHLYIVVMQKRPRALSKQMRCICGQVDAIRVDKNPSVTPTSDVTTGDPFRS